MCAGKMRLPPECICVCFLKSRAMKLAYLVLPGSRSLARRSTGWDTKIFSSQSAGNSKAVDEVFRNY